MDLMTDDLLEWIIELIKQDNLIKFYKSKYWKLIRNERRKRDNYECQECKRQGKVKTNVLLNVHHIQEVKIRPDLALHLDNTALVCVDCHNKEHRRQWKKHKRKVWADEKW